MDRVYYLILYPKQGIVKYPLVNFNKEICNWATISLIDLPKIVNYTFHEYKRRTFGSYAVATTNGKNITMHELIMGERPEGKIIDHINSDGLDNRRENLRFATLSQNGQNKIKQKGKYQSDYTGVSNTENGKYRATISNGSYIHIGRFNTEEEAAKAYDVYAVHYYGIDGKTNGLLTEDEMQDILKNGIPKEYQRKAERELPKCILRKNSGYCYQVGRNGVRYYKKYDTLEEAIIGRDELIEKLDNEILNDVPTEITRNKNGIAVIYLKDRKGNIKGESLVDDHTWYDLVKYKWYLRDDGYASGKVDKVQMMMHIYIYKKYKGDIPEGHTIDHIECSLLDNRLDKLRTATNSLQSHNRPNSKNSICKYKGVTINGNKFVVNSHGKRYSFDYMEDAARKYNEIVKEVYGDDARLNVIDDQKTSIHDLLPTEITVDYIKSIKYVELFNLVVQRMKWGGRNGYFSVKKTRIYNLEHFKARAIDILNGVL